MDDAVTCRACGGEMDWPRLDDVRPMRRHQADNAQRLRLVCESCWRRIPARLRIAVVIGYRHRRTDLTRYSDAQAGILQWCRDQSAGRTEAEAQ